ncbi:MAG: hypothetical protein LBL45_04140 [Treponema sp.]|jgi:hypothetical protein|nr:hypothetical protein [Treponema sp.]
MDILTRRSSTGMLEGPFQQALERRFCHVILPFFPVLFDDFNRDGLIAQNPQLCSSHAVEFENRVFTVFAAGEGEALVQNPRFFLFAGFSAVGSELRCYFVFSDMANPMRSSRLQSGRNVSPWLDFYMAQTFLNGLILRGAIRTLDCLIQNQ